MLNIQLTTSTCKVSQLPFMLKKNISLQESWKKNQCFKTSKTFLNAHPRRLLVDFLVQLLKKKKKQ